jgi:hypothetical protein
MPRAAGEFIAMLRVLSFCWRRWALFSMLGCHSAWSEWLERDWLDGSHRGDRLLLPARAAIWEISPQLSNFAILRFDSNSRGTVALSQMAFDAVLGTTQQAEVYSKLFV